MLIQLLATWIPALLIGLSGVLKLSGNPKILETMTTLGVGRYVRLLGVMELAFAALFVVPNTPTRSGWTRSGSANIIVASFWIPRLRSSLALRRHGRSASG